MEDQVKEYLSKLGKKGGAAVKAKYGQDYYKKIGAKGNKVKAAKKNAK